MDTQTFGKRRIDQRNKFTPSCNLSVFEELDVDILYDAPPDQQHKSFIRNIDTTINWESIKKIRKMTSLKIILKGIADPADVLLAEEAGVDALWVSNHGGRQLDTAPATIEVLPAIRHEVNSTFIIY